VSIIGAIVAGIVATGLMSLALSGAQRMAMPKIDFVGLLGTLFSARENRIIGWILHGVFGMLFAIVYATVWSLGIVSPGVTEGLIFGIAHWLIAGFLIGLLSAVHAGIRAGTVKDPGRYLSNLDASMGFFGGLMSHIIYGLTVGLVYNFFKLASG
jgi:hypothetical protein